MKLKNATVVITGASSGIGRAAALRFARKGANLVLAARSEDALEEVAQQCRRHKVQAVAVPTDVTDMNAVDELALAAVEEFGGIDVWVNDAAVSVFSPFLDMPLDDFRRVLTVDVMGYVHGARAALPIMQKQGKPGKGHGVLINVSSVSGVVPQPYVAPYSMAKAAVRALGTSLRSELMLQKSKIEVVSILPAAIDTRFFQHSGNYTGRQVKAMPPVYPPELVAKAIVKAAVKPKHEVVVGAIAKSMVKQHKVAPTSVEASMAVQTATGHLSLKKSAPNGTGILYTPTTSVEEASITGGWRGKKRTGRRVALALAGGSAAVVAVTRSKRKS